MDEWKKSSKEGNTGGRKEVNNVEMFKAFEKKNHTDGSLIIRFTYFSL